ncbi:DUF4124 domain-containing protein [Nitrosomonas sp. JL21]|uniref:DUF4124 domain-containing protein n=1 Tax=Nitrosomonas sp. JL21 TaxID=153949 RepID=UPI00136B3DD5|nr:DUF4124 domain-containing protein [Nitrosomonas sp. JL21]MBL8497790.1 DUF4124 domain-containing protein [Nitrosomonas sp.]MCC7091176.1 DUF4124 domain-containing protein [Nitrosomonas sp.]MXS76737.1 DUF4124 domain-containing protein [Nitrosomonas sp. JL21]
MIKNLLFFITLSFAYPALAGIYKQVDRDGSVTYSNVPSDSAKKVDLPAIVVVPAVNSNEIDERITKRRESAKIDEQREEIQKKIAEEESRLNEIKNEYKDGEPDRLGSERNYQRYLNRVERLREEINVRERNLNLLREELRKIPSKNK